jgi:hypothetical protein
MQTNVVSKLLVFTLMTSVAGCVFYFKQQFSLYSVKLETLAEMKLEKEQTFRVPRARPLRLFRPPRVVPSFIVLLTSIFKSSEKSSVEDDDFRVVSTPPALSNQLKQVELIEDLTRLYIKDGYALAEMRAFTHVSTTLTARLLACYNALNLYSNRGKNSERLKEVIKTILVKNSDVTFFEVMITFEDTLSAFPDVAISVLDLIDQMNLTSDQKTSYFTTFLNRELSGGQSKSVHIALEKLKTQDMQSSQIRDVVENFIKKNADDPGKRRQAVSLSKAYFPDYVQTSSEDSTDDE